MHVADLQSPRGCPSAAVIFGCSLLVIAFSSPLPAGAAEPSDKDVSLPGLVPVPAKLPGVGRWQLAQRLPVGYLWAAAWSPDGKQIALGESRYVRVCDAETLAPVRFLVGHVDRVTSIAYHQKGSKIATSSFDGTVRVWEIDGAPKAVLKGHDAPVRDVCWSPDGNQLASAGDDGTVRLWNADGSAAAVFKEHEAPVNCVSWSHDGERIASGDANRMVRIWARDGKSIAVCEGHHGKVSCVTWSPDGQTVASADLGFKDPVTNAYSASIRFWTREGKEQKSLELGEPVRSLAYSPNGESLAAGHERGSASLMQKDGTGVSTLRNSGMAIAWSPDSRKIVATGRGQASISGIDGSAGATLVRANSRRYLIVDWSPDGKYLAAHSLGGTVNLWKENGQIGPEFPQPVAGTVGMAWDADSRRFLTSTESELRFWNIDGTQGKPLDGVMGRSDRIAWSRDGQRIACANSYNSSASPIQLRDSGGKLLKTLAGHANGTTMLAWSPDSKLLASSGRDGTVRLWTSDGEPAAVMEGLTRDVDSVCWSGDSRSIVAGYDSGDFQFWNADGTPGPEVPAHDDTIMFNAFSPDGKRLATGSWDESIKLWDQQGKELRKLNGHAGPLYWLSWHPDNRRLVSGSYDATARVWDADTGEQQMIIFSLNAQTAVAVTRTGEIHGGTPELLDREFLFLVEQPNGAMEVLSHAQFKQRTEAGK